MSYVRFKNVGVITASQGQAYTFQIADDNIRERVHERDKSTRSLNWGDRTLTVDGWEVVPFGDDNNLPNEIRNTIALHNLAPRVFTKKKFLIWGSGPILYTMTKDENGRPAKKYVDDKEIEDWLKSWDHEAYLQRCIEDFNYLEGIFTKVNPARSMRLNQPYIHSLEYLDAKFTRLGYKAKELWQIPKATHALYGRWDMISQIPIHVYPLFERELPKNTSVHYSHLFSFGQDAYAVPDVLGSLPWIRRARAIPYVLEALTNNSLHIRWHIISPKKYWDDIRSRLMEQCTQKNEKYTDEMLENVKDEIFENLEKVLSGQDNVGKYWTSESINEIIPGAGLVEHKWELVPIEQKIKEFVTAQLEIAKQAQFETIAGLGLHQALANVGGGGKSDSGSEQLYAYKNHILTELTLPINIITKAINKAIEINWPNKNIRLGFYHQLPEKEQDIEPSKRVKNADI